MQKSKGFTIIELIVVIAIIAILASIVLVNVTSYLNKAKDAGVIEYVHQLQSAAMAFYLSGFTYTGVTSDATYAAIVSKIGAINPAPTVTTYINAATGAVGTTYCVKSTMPSGATTWCSDSTGYVGTLASGKCTATTDATTTTCQ
ncbi:MAG: prepilin-type N-terminal cleavage/methylation domain-containing protein [Candidatus Staskawiczbacteria bacterium]|nr:prepilin-type N-terminal cleavage/methylation domain-containing protein [Candidatus Staskawiczbacteria bacterium]